MLAYRRVTGNASRGLPNAVDLTLGHAPLVKSSRCRNDLAIETVESVMAARLAGVPGIHSAVEPFDAGLAAGPANERLNASGQGEAT